MDLQNTVERAIFKKINFDLTNHGKPKKMSEETNYTERVST